MNILLFIALLSVPFLSAPDTPYCAGYVKELIFYVLSLIGISITLIRTRQWDIWIYDIVALLLLFVIVVNPRFWDNEAYIAIALVLIWWSISRSHWSKIMLYGLIMTGVIHAVVSLNQIVLFPPPPLKGVMGNSGIMGIYIAIVVPLALGLAFAERQWWIKMLMTGVVLLLLTTLLITQSRTALLAVVAGCGYLVWRFTPLKRHCTRWMQNRQVIWFGGFALAALLVAGTVALLQYRMGSVSGRALIYRSTLGMIADKPLLGHGYNTFAARYPDYQADYFANHPDSPLVPYSDNSEVAFNEYLHLTAEYGVLGLLITIALLVALFRIPNASGPMVVICKASLIALLVTACFSYPLRRYETLLVAMVITGILASQDARKVFTLPHWVLCVLTPALVWFYFCFGKIISNRIIGYPIWAEAQSGRMNMEQRLGLYEAANRYMNHDVAFLYNYAVTLSLYGEHAAANTLFGKVLPYLNTYNIQVMIGANNEQLGALNEAESFYIHAKHMVPNRFYPLYQLMILYRTQGDSINMRNVARDIIDKEIKIPSYTVSRIKKEAGMLVEESSVFRKSVE